MGSTLHGSLLCSSRLLLLWMIAASLTGIASASSESLARSSSVALVAATLMWHATPTVAQVNLAQGKTATQISTMFGPAAAIDGDTTTTSCTNEDTDTWWAVDLAAQYEITTVNVTTFTDNNDRVYVLGLINFKVGLADAAPAVGALINTITYTDCGEYMGSVDETSSVTFSIDCAATGQQFQFVIIHGSRSVNARLCMAEVEVFGQTMTTGSTMSTTPAATTAATTADPAATTAATTADPSVTTTTTAAVTTTAATTTAATESATTSAPSSTVPLVAALITLGALYGAAAIGVCCFVSIPRYLARRRATLGVENIVVEEIVRQPPPPQQFYPEPAPPPFQRSNYYPQRRRYY